MSDNLSLPTARSLSSEVAARFRPRKRGKPYPWPPFTMTWAEIAAAVFRASEAWVRDHLPMDFPRPDPALDVFATKAVEAWVNRPFGLATPDGDPHDAEDILIRRANGQGQGPLPDRTASQKRRDTVLVANTEIGGSRLPPEKA
jgi:hypothetical protein